MLHRVKKDNDIHEGKWNGLGGKLHAHESPEDCVIREVEEESGLHIDAPDFLAMMTFPRFAHDEDWYVFLFTAEKFSGTLIEDPPEGHLEWVDDDRLLSLNLWEGDRIFLPWMLDKRRFSAKFEYEQGRLQRHSVHFYD